MSKFLDQMYEEVRGREDMKESLQKAVSSGESIHSLNESNFQDSSLRATGLQGFNAVRNLRTLVQQNGHDLFLACEEIVQRALDLTRDSDVEGKRIVSEHGKYLDRVLHEFMDAVQKMEEGGSGLAESNKDLIEENERLKGELEGMRLSFGETEEHLRHVKEERDRAERAAASSKKTSALSRWQQGKAKVASGADDLAKQLQGKIIEMQEEIDRLELEAAEAKYNAESLQEDLKGKDKEIYQLHKKVEQNIDDASGAEEQSRQLQDYNRKMEEQAAALAAQLKDMEGLTAKLEVQVPSKIAAVKQDTDRALTAMMEEVRQLTELLEAQQPSSERLDAPTDATQSRRSTSKKAVAARSSSSAGGGDSVQGFGVARVKKAKELLEELIEQGARRDRRRTGGEQASTQTDEGWREGEVKAEAERLLKERSREIEREREQAERERMKEQAEQQIDAKRQQDEIRRLCKFVTEFQYEVVSKMFSDGGDGGGGGNGTSGGGGDGGAGGGREERRRQEAERERKLNGRMAEMVNDVEGGEGFIKGILNSTLRFLEKGRQSTGLARVARAGNEWDESAEGRQLRQEMAHSQFERLSSKALLKNKGDAAAALLGARSPRGQVKFAQWVLDLEERQRRMDERWAAKQKRLFEERSAAILKAAMFCEVPPLDAFAKYALPPQTRTAQPLLAKFNFPEREPKHQFLYAKPPPLAPPHTSGVGALLRQAMDRAKEAGWPPPPGSAADTQLHSHREASLSEETSPLAPPQGRSSESGGTHGSVATVTPSLGTPVSFHGSIPPQSFRRSKTAHGSSRQLEVRGPSAGLPPHHGHGTPITSALPQRPIRTSLSRDSPRRQGSGSASGRPGSHSNSAGRRSDSGLALAPNLRPSSSGSAGLGALSGVGAEPQQEHERSPLPGIAGATVSEFTFPSGMAPPD